MRRNFGRFVDTLAELRLGLGERVAVHLFDGAGDHWSSAEFELQAQHRSAVEDDDLLILALFACESTSMEIDVLSQFIVENSAGDMLMVSTE